MTDAYFMQVNLPNDYGLPTSSAHYSAEGSSKSDLSHPTAKETTKLPTLPTSCDTPAVTLPMLSTQVKV